MSDFTMPIFSTLAISQKGPKDKNKDAVARIHEALPRVQADDGTFFRTQLVRMSEVTKEAVHKELMHLVEAGLLDAKTILFGPRSRLNKDNPYVKAAAMRRPIHKVRGAKDVMEYCVKTLEAA